MVQDVFHYQSVYDYKATVLDMLKLSFPQLTMEELNEAIDSAILKTAKDYPVEVDNNYKHTVKKSTIYKLTQYIYSRKPILTSYGVMFENHECGIVNPLKELFTYFLEDRKRLKNIMKTFPKGSEDYERYNLAQGLRKISSNSIYGMSGLPSSYFYNLYFVACITKQGQSSISNAILLFESFLANNVQFGSLDEIIEFIHNVINDPRTYDDSDILDHDIDIADCWMKIMLGCGFGKYIPDESDMTTVWNILDQLTQEDINRLYYKNNLYEFCNNASIRRVIVYILKLLEKPFLDPNEPPEEIYVELNELKNLMYEYVYYRHIYPDKIEKCVTMFKAASVLTDTDSSMISLDAWYRYVLDFVYDLDLKIKTQSVDESKFELDGEVNVTEEEPVYDYDFFTDEFVEAKSAVSANKIIPQMGLRHSICNIMLYIVSELSKDYMRLYSGNYNSHDDEHCLLVLKNEMFMKRIMIQAAARKHYAYYLEVSEGHLVPKEASLGITGLEMIKSTTRESVRDRLKKILLEQILDAGVIDQRRILVELVKFEKEIYNSLVNKEVKYYRPVTFLSIDSYEKADDQYTVRAAVVYNETKDEDMPPFNLHERNSGLLIKVKINPITTAHLEEDNPRIWKILQELFNRKEFSRGITQYIIPYDVSIPEWVVEFIDYYQIINDNIKTFPLESVGLVGKAINSSVNHSNVLKIV